MKSKFCNCLCHASNALARNMTKIMDDELAGISLTSSYAYLLMEVAGDPGVNPTVISQSLELSPSTVTRLIEKMERRGLMTRKQEGRNTEVYLTKEGEKFMKKVSQCLDRVAVRYNAILGEKTVDRLTKSVYNASMKLEMK